jgi:hypothetical protein
VMFILEVLIACSLQAYQKLTCQDQFGSHASSSE